MWYVQRFAPPPSLPPCMGPIGINSAARGRIDGAVIAAAPECGRTPPPADPAYDRALLSASEDTNGVEPAPLSSELGLKTLASVIADECYQIQKREKVSKQKTRLQPGPFQKTMLYASTAATSPYLHAEAKSTYSSGSRARGTGTPPSTNSEIDGAAKERRGGDAASLAAGCMKRHESPFVQVPRKKNLQTRSLGGPLDAGVGVRRMLRKAFVALSIATAWSPEWKWQCRTEEWKWQCGTNAPAVEDDITTWARAIVVLTKAPFPG